MLDARGVPGGTLGVVSPGNMGSPHNAVPLSMLPSGSFATLSGDRLEENDRAILRAMGIGHRAPVRICRQGEPCIVEVQNTRVGLARAIADLLDTIPDEPRGEETLPLASTELPIAATA